MSQFRPPSQPEWNQTESDQTNNQSSPRPFISRLQTPPLDQPYTRPERYYQSPTPPPPPKQRKPTRSRNQDKQDLTAIGFIIGVIVLIAVIGGIFHFSSGNTSSSTSQTSNNNLTTPTDQTTTAPQTTLYNPGDVITSGNWQLTLNSAKTTIDDGPYHAPKAGNVFLILNVTLKNMDTNNQNASSFLMFTLRDQQGYSYAETALLNSQSPDGAVVAGQKIRGNLPYEVPKSITSLVLQFEPAIGDTADIVQWNVSV